MHQNVKFEVCGHFFEHATFSLDFCSFFSLQTFKTTLSNGKFLFCICTFTHPKYSIPKPTTPLCKQDASHNGQSIHHLKTKWVSFSISSREPIVTRPHLHDHTMLSVHCKTFWLQRPQNLKCYPFS